MVSLKAWDTIVQDDHKVIVELPKNIPVGTPVKVNVIQAEGIEVRVEFGEVSLVGKSERASLREQMIAKGLMDTSYSLPLDTAVPTDEEVNAAAERTAALGGRTLEEIIDEDRGAW